VHLRRVTPSFRGAPKRREPGIHGQIPLRVSLAPLHVSNSHALVISKAVIASQRGAHSRDPLARNDDEPTRASAFSRRDAPELCVDFSPLE